MGVRSEGNGQRDGWKLLIGLSVVCAVLVFVGGFLHRRALDSAVADRQAKSVALVNTKVADAAKHADLAKPLKGSAAAHLTKELDLPAGTDLRLFSGAGGVLYSSPGMPSFPADAEGLQSAASGDPAHVIDDADLRVYAPIDGKGPKPVAIAAVVSNYTQLRDDAAGPLDGVRLPIVALGVVLLVTGLLLMVRATKGATAKTPAAAADPSAPKAKTPSSGKGRVTGFEPVPVTTGPTIQRVDVDEDPTDAVSATVEGASEPTPKDASPTEAPASRTVFGLRLPSKKPKEAAASSQAPAPEAAAPKGKRSLFARKEAAAEPAAAADVSVDKAASALDREIAIRQALEDQLEQLRTRMQMQDVEAANMKKELLAELEAANARAEDALARAQDAGSITAGSPAPQPATAPTATAPDGAAMRVQQLERELAEARSMSTDAVARAEALQRQLDEAKAAPAADPAAAAKLAEVTAQLTDAQQRASAAEQRAASVESVRDELEVRVAQLGTKASELEQRATELEASLNEANAGGDAVRAEIATLTAALAAANARVSELEAASRAGTLEADNRTDAHGVSADAGTAEPSTNGEASVPAAAHDRLASRFETSESDAAPVLSTEPEPVASREEDVREVALATEKGAALAEPEVHEPESHDEASDGPEPVVADEVHEPESPIEDTPAESARTPATPTVEWHATTAPAPQAAQSSPRSTASSNGGIPPAPSSDARYDDMWTAAFAEPQPQPQPEPEAEAEPEPEAERQPEAEAERQPEPEPARAGTARTEDAPQAGSQPAPEPNATMSPEDRPSPPEDGLSVEDDMWSLRARLEAASRKAHETD